MRKPREIIKEVVESPEAQQAVVNIKSNAIHHWYIIVIIVLLCIGGFEWQMWQSANKKYESEKAKNTITADIATLEKKLDGLKEREKSYEGIESSTARLNAAIVALETKRKELERIKKGVLLNEIKKMDEKALVATFGTLGIAGTISTCSESDK